MPDIKKVVDDHPLAVLAGVCVVAAGCSAAVVGWFWEKSESLQARGFDQQLASAQAEYDGEIADLKQRLLSIERRVSGDTLHIDVSKLPISSTEVPALPPSYQRFADGRFFVSPPKSTGWTQQQASQVDLAVSIIGEGARAIANLPGGLGEVLSEKTGMLWQSAEAMPIPISPNSALAKNMGMTELQLRPFVFVMPMDQALIERTTKALGQVLLSEDLLGSDAEATAMSTASGGQATGDSTPQQPNEGALSEADVNDVISTLSGMSRSDLASFALSDLIISTVQLSFISGGTFRIIAADKKGNVFYLRTHLVFTGPPDPQTGSGQISYLDQEFFFVGTPRGGLLIRVGIPSRDLRTADYAWTQAWLTSLRVSTE